MKIFAWYLDMIEISIFDVQTNQNELPAAINVPDWTYWLATIYNDYNEDWLGTKQRNICKEISRLGGYLSVSHSSTVLRLVI